MNGFDADLSGIGAAAAALRHTADALDLHVAPVGDVGPGRLNTVVHALLASAATDVTRARATVTELAESAARVRDTYAELDTGTARRFDQGSW